MLKSAAAYAEDEAACDQAGVCREPLKLKPEFRKLIEQYDTIMEKVCHARRKQYMSDMIICWIEFCVGHA